MSKLPITHMTLYKNGVGFYERRADIEEKEIILSFRVSEMDDILKSLTIIDWGKGKVIGLEYPTPQDPSELLTNQRINLQDRRSLRDLLKSLCGHRVRLLMGDTIRVANYPTQAKSIAGTLIGLDEFEDQPSVKSTLISFLKDDNSQIYTFELGELAGIELMDEDYIDDLRFYLNVISKSNDNCEIKVRLSPGRHDIAVSYIAPAPTWRVSYRFVGDTKNKDGNPRAMLLGLGIIDNNLEEDIKDASISLVAGMPISFIYDLYTPFNPHRPRINEDSHSLLMQNEAEPFTSETLELPLKVSEENLGFDIEPKFNLNQRDRGKLTGKQIEKIIDNNTHAESLGATFQYNIDTPITIGRGNSAIVPIFSTSLGYRKDLIYNHSFSDTHPILIIRMKNQTDFVFEKGPITVIEDGNYLGEAVLPFSSSTSEMIIPYAVELGITVLQNEEQRTEMRGLGIKDNNLLFVEWDILVREYTIKNNTLETHTFLIEHKRNPNYELHESPKPKERQNDIYRFEVQISPGSERILKIKERRLRTRQEELRRQSHNGLKQLLKDELMDEKTNNQLIEMLNLWEQISDKEKQIDLIKSQREDIINTQEQLRKNFAVLGSTGKEGALRNTYIDKLHNSEITLDSLFKTENELNQEIDTIELDISKRLSEIKNP